MKYLLPRLIDLSGIGLSPLAVAQDDAYALIDAQLFYGVDNRIHEDTTILVKTGNIECIAKSGTP